MMEKSKEGKHFSEDGLNSLRYCICIYCKMQFTRNYLIRKNMPFIAIYFIILCRYELLQTDENLLYTRILVKLPPAPKVAKKKHWLDIAGGSIKHTIDGAFKNMASAVANKVCIKRVACIK